MSREQSTICPICKKQRAAEAPGSLTSFLFQEMRCTCEAGATEGRRAAPDFARCKDCGRIVLDKAGSFTSFLFHDLCCRCSDRSINPPQSKNEAFLSTRFRRTDRATKSSVTGSTRNWRRKDSDAMTELQVEQVIGGYRLLKQIGRGGMGIVFLAEYLSLNRFCALKFLAPSMVSDQSWIMFQNEAKIVAGLNHPTICQIYDMGVHDGRLPFYAMEFLEGESLESILLTQRTLTVGAALEVFSKVSEGLSYAHKHGVVHKDIKPANIMLTPLADGHVGIKILDFGIAELVDSQNEERKSPGEVVGSAFYMSPEQLGGTKLDQRSDIYSIGCALFEALTGEPPFTGETREALVEQHCNDEAPTLQQRTNIKFPEELERVLKKSLAKDPEARYQTADQLFDDLEQLLITKQLSDVELLPIESSINTTNAPTPPTLAGHWGVAFILLATAIFLGLGYLAVTYWVQSFSTDSESKSTHTVSSKHAKSDGDSPTVMKSNSEKTYFDALHSKAEQYTDVATEPKGFIKTGMGMAQVEESEQAIRLLKRGLGLDPKLWTPEVSDALVKSYIDMGRFEEALAEVTITIKHSPSHYRYRTKGQILCQMNRNKEAIKCFNMATKLKPDEYWNYFDRGTCYMILNQNEQAIADFTKLISLKPDEARGYALRAKCYKRVGNDKLAEFDLAEAARLGRLEMD